MTYEVISVSVEVTREQMMDRPKGAIEAQVISESIRALSKRLLEDDLVSAYREYSIEKCSEVHTLSVRVEKP